MSRNFQLYPNIWGKKKTTYKCHVYIFACIILCLDFYIKSFKPLTESFTLPHIIEVSLGKAPSHDENHWASCSKVKWERVWVSRFTDIISISKVDKRVNKMHINIRTPTPTNQNIPPEVLPLWEERDGQQSMKIQTFHKEPEEACHNAILEKDNHSFAANLKIRDRGNKNGFEEVIQTLECSSFSRVGASWYLPRWYKKVCSVTTAFPQGTLHWTVIKRTIFKLAKTFTGKNKMIFVIPQITNPNICRYASHVLPSQCSSFFGFLKAVVQFGWNRWEVERICNGKTVRHGRQTAGRL